MNPKIQFSIILFLLTLIACSNFKPNAENDLIKENLLGNINSISEVSYLAEEAENGIIKGQRNRASIDKDYIRNYNIEGYLIKEDRFYSDGNLFEKVEFVYDDQGNKIEKNIIRPGGRAEFVGQILYLYKNGRMVGETEYSTTGDLIINKNFEFDSNGNTIKEIRTYPKAKSSERTFEYDNTGNMIGKKIFYSSGDLSQGFVYNYDNKGNKIEDIYFNRDNKSSSRKDIYTYDDKNNINEIKIFYDGHLEKKVNNTFQYDEKGNWVEKVIFENDIPQHIVEREIIYFK